MTGSKAELVRTTGLFDSGVGGLSVLRQLERIPNLSRHSQRHKFLYLGDTARCPYGNRAEQEISTFACEILSWLAERGVDQVIMACNTSAAVVGVHEREQFGLPIYDLIAATGRFVASLNLRTAVLATSATVKSHAFAQAIYQHNSSAQVMEIACPELVPLIESGLINHSETLNVLRKYVSELSHYNIGAVILGCTHYPFLRKSLAEMLSPGVIIIDPAEELVKEMMGSESLNSSGEPGLRVPRRAVEKTIFTTGCTESFHATAEICLGTSPGTVYGITINDLRNAHANRQAELVARTAAIPSPVGAPEQIFYPV